MESREGELRMKEKKFLFVFALVLLTLQSCGNRGKSADSNDDISLGSIIVGSLDWKEITSLSPTSPIFENASFVADVDLPAFGSRCTGFLISEDVLMTNQHCVTRESDARGLTAAFNHVAGVPESQWDKYNCSEFIGNNNALDFALVRCQGSPGAQYGYAQLSDQFYGAGEQIYIVQQNCDYYTNRGCDHSKKYSEGSLTNARSTSYTHNADTLGGSSGSPVFSKQNNQVIGIHHAGRGNNGQGRGLENYAVPMDKIVAYIQSNFPGVLGSSGGNGGGQNPPVPSVEEPNNSFADAFELQSSSESSQFKIDSANDLDYFKFTLAQDGAASIKIEFSHSQGDLDMKLFDNSFKQLKSSTSVNNQEEFAEQLSAGTYYVQVYGYRGAQNDYSLSFQSDAAGGAQVPKEPNNSFDTAYNVFQESSGEITGAGEKDYFYFDLVSRGSVKVQMDIDASAGDLDLELYDENFRKVASSLGVTKVEQISRSLNVGRYYVVVKGYRNASGGYALSVE